MGPADGATREETLAEIERVAREVFGYDRLRPGQAEAMAGLVEGRDVLLVMPTGAGKSAVNQVPAVLLKGPTVVISPLIALQRDQVEALREPCGNCDTCRAGTAKEAADVSDMPYPLQSRVRHEQFGEGVVMGDEGGGPAA